MTPRQLSRCGGALALPTRILGDGDPLRAGAVGQLLNAPGGVLGLSLDGDIGEYAVQSGVRRCGRRDRGHRGTGHGRTSAQA